MRRKCLGAGTKNTRMKPIVLVGAILGLLAAIFMTAGIFLLYPLDQGAQPTIPVPPSLIVLFEVTMLGTMWSAFFGFLFVNRFPTFGEPVYDRRITTGEIGVLVHVDASSLPAVRGVLEETGAHDIEVEDSGRRRVDTRAWIRFVAAGGFLLIFVSVLGALFWYDILRIPFPSQMVHQSSTGYVEGPRLAAPADAVPLQGPVLVAGQPATEPLPADANSLQRGQVLFDVTCIVCHGQKWHGRWPTQWILLAQAGRPYRRVGQGYLG